MLRTGPGSIVGLLVLFLAAVPGLAETDAVDQAIDQQVSAGILPVPDYSGDFRSRTNLTGDWGGRRQEWAEDGFTFNLRWFQVGQGVVDGGLRERSTYVTNLDYLFHFDLDRMGILPGAVVTVRGQSRFGNTVNGDAGLLLPPNTSSLFPYTRELDDNVSIAVTELNWLQFLSAEFALLAGKVTTLSSSNEFAGGEGRTQFMNFQLLYSAVTAQIAPYSTLAAGLLWMPSRTVTVSSLLLNLDEASTTSGFDGFGEGASWITGADFRFALGELPGGANLSAALGFGRNFARIGGINIGAGPGLSLDTKKRTWAVFSNAWQYLYVEEGSAEEITPDNGEQDLQGLGFFAIIGFADRSTNPASLTLAGGLSWRGLIPGRDDDTCAIGYFHNELRDPRTLSGFRLGTSIAGMEVYYNIALAEAARLTLDFQWTKSAFPDVDNAVILGLRLNLDF